jgi:lia operon protein LiaG
MTRILVRRAAVASALAFAVLSGPGAADAQQAEQYRLRGEQVAIYNLAGETRVEAGSGSEVVVEVTRGGSDARRLDLQTGRVRGQEALRVRAPGDRVVYPRLGRGSRTQIRVRDDGTFGRGSSGGRRVTIAGSGNGLEAFADLQVRVPAGQRIAIHQGTGRVWISNVDGELRVEGSSTTVEAERTRGSLVVDVGSGRVRVQQAEGLVDVDTGSGSVELSGIRASRLRVDTGSGGVSGRAIDAAEMNVDVGSGSVRLADVRVGQAVIDTGSGGVQLGLGSAVRSLRIGTGSGGVTLTVPPTFGAAFEIRTGSGGINIDLPTESMNRSRSSLSARTGDGEGRVRISTGSGGVRVREG